MTKKPERHKEEDEPIIIRESAPGVCRFPIGGPCGIVTYHEKGLALYVNKRVRKAVKAALKKQRFPIED